MHNKHLNEEKDVEEEIIQAFVFIIGYGGEVMLVNLTLYLW
jgi:hypothetical protein